MKKFALSVFALLLLITLFSGCSESGPVQSVQDEKISIVCTIFPQYDWTRQIIGEDNMDNFDLSLLIESRVDLHSYNPSVQDIAKIKTSDVFIYVGGDSDIWTEAVLKDANPDIIAINLLDILGDIVLIDDYIGEYHDHGEEYHDHSGEYHDHGENYHDHGEEYHDDSEHELHVDEHIWLSLRNAKIICAAIADTLIEIDPAGAQSYIANLEAYTAILSKMDADFQSVVNNTNINTLVFADRFPFRYLMNDYGLNYYAAFSGCSAETEASFITIISLADRLNQLGSNVVMVTECSDQAIARTVISNTTDKNQQILVLDSMQSITSDDILNGATYISIMEYNLNVLKEALK